MHMRMVKYPIVFCHTRPFSERDVTVSAIALSDVETPRVIEAYISITIVADTCHNNS